ncbi:carbohydrate kinase family protein [Natronogracilivirga saccharolytica]|uniref:Carbohydrate kinase n=1 Tax=Natronogracilivirga saccharolytica TaxID=2812953 RepID=A0A8J7UUZ1_9BACT|nr:carbohydrate kinase [Natronogracilivirga saccharolytica]MBP3191986.1 carbohydrate kinase [Natronogracilivirga saccharolytica]
MNKPVIAGLGEVLWDVFPEYKRAGGAPANVAFHASQLGNRGIPASRVGDDEDGAELLNLLSSHGLDISYIQKDDVAPTGTVEVFISDGEASYTISEDVAWDHLALTSSWIDLAREADAVCFGTLAQRDEISRRTIRQFLENTSGDCLKIADINLREPHYTDDIIKKTIELADVVKLNEAEWKQLGEISGADDVRQWLLNEMNVTTICLTKGSDGAELMTADEHLIEPVHPVDSSNGDSVGVGDAFTAALTHHLLRKTPLDVTIRVANKYAAQVAARKGAMPELPEAVLSSLS